VIAARINPVILDSFVSFPPGLQCAQPLALQPIAMLSYKLEFAYIAFWRIFPPHLRVTGDIQLQECSA
jgi:hypothetical protein